MPIVMRLDRVMAERKITSTELAARIGTSTVNLSNIKNGKIKGMRFSTLEAMCQVLKCKPGDIIDYITPEEAAEQQERGEIRERNYASAATRKSLDEGVVGLDIAAATSIE